MYSRNENFCSLEASQQGSAVCTYQVVALSDKQASRVGQRQAEGDHDEDCAPELENGVLEAELAAHGGFNNGWTRQQLVKLACAPHIQT